MQNFALLAISVLALFGRILQPAPQAPIQAAFGHSDIYVVKLGEDPIPITGGNILAIYPTWSADGKHLAYLAEPAARPTGEMHLMVRDMESGSTQQVSSLALNNEAHLAWSPDGQQIALTLGALYVVDVASQETRQLSVDGISAQFPTWSPDSRQIAFKGMGDIYLVDANGGETKKITQTIRSGYSYQTQWSYSTNTLLFVTNTETHVSVNLYDPTDGSITEVLHTRNPVYVPQWSPDGSQIAFSTWGEPDGELAVVDGFDVYVMQADGSDLRPISGVGSDGLVGWAGDSQHVVYRRGEPGGAAVDIVIVDVVSGDTAVIDNTLLASLCAYNGCADMAVRP